MDIEFDPAKNVINQLKHGISVEAAADMDFAQAIVIEDWRFDYGEVRYVAYGPIEGRLHALWFTWRGQAVRVIGLRKANTRERKRYEQAR